MELTSFLLSNTTAGIYFVVLFTTSSALKNMSNKSTVKLILKMKNKKLFKNLFTKLIKIKAKLNCKGNSLSQTATLNTCVSAGLLPREGALWNGYFPEFNSCLFSTT